jgi:hypothetical protein
MSRIDEEMAEAVVDALADWIESDWYCTYCYITAAFPHGTQLWGQPGKPLVCRRCSHEFPKHIMQEDGSVFLR